MNKPSESLRSRLASAMEMKKYSPAELSEKSGVSNSQLSFYLSGQRSPSIDSLAALAKALDVTTDSLLGISSVLSKTVITPEEMAAHILERMGLEKERLAFTLAVLRADQTEMEGFRSLIKGFNGRNSKSSKNCASG